jgi:hypothetical protein
MAVHEASHNQQDDFIRYDGDVLKGISHDFEGVGRRDAKHQELVHLENLDLARGACATSAQEAREYLRSALARRTERWRYTVARYQKDPSAWERYNAGVEGGAKYVDTHLKALWVDVSKATLLGSDPLFHNFDAYKGDNLTFWCRKIGDTRSWSYWTKLGLGYALIMDKIRPGWKTEVFASQHFFDDLFAQEHLLPQ